MNSEEKAKVEEMCAAGMSPNALYKIFKDLNKEEIDSVYNEYLNQNNDYIDEGISISMNCS